jgi:hypothetical protein
VDLELSSLGNLENYPLIYRWGLKQQLKYCR